MSLIEERERVLEQVQLKTYQNFLEKKLKFVLLEAAGLNSLIAHKAGKDIMDLYERKLKKKNPKKRKK